MNQAGASAPPQPNPDYWTPTFQDEWALYAGLEEENPSFFYSAGREHRVDQDGYPMLDERGEPIPLPDEENGHFQFHAAPHVYRMTNPGNGWGKTTAVGVEVDWWMQHTHPYQQVPDHRLIGLWVCEKFQQFEIQRPKISRWWKRGVNESFNSQYKRFAWPKVDGAMGNTGGDLFVISMDSDWKTMQGTEPDIVIIDEECPVKLWRELQMRRRGKSKTRYLISATSTDGLGWMYHDLYLPWLKYHEALGMGEDQAMRAQLHRCADRALRDVPWIWCWPKGNIVDNPIATPQDVAEYRAKTFTSAAERHVRLYGGFRDFAGQPRFDLDNLERMRRLIRPGASGVIKWQAA